MSWSHPSQAVYASQDPYSYPPQQQHFTDSSYVGRDEAIPGGRHQAANTYPPPQQLQGSNFDLTPGSEAFEYEKGLNPVTRGSIAAQMAAEGQIPKKEGLRMWRTDEHKGTFTRGGRGRMCARVCCCAIMLVIIILVGVVSAFLLWTKPPEVSFNGIELPTNGQEVTVQTDGFLIDFKLNIGVINPNFFGVKFKKIAAQAYYPLKPSTSFGGGSLTDVDIKKTSNTTILFPFEVNYTTNYDGDLVVLRDIATRCGFYNTSSSISNTDLTVDYTITLTFKVIAITISPSFSSSTSLACPLNESDVASLLGNLGSGSLGRRRSLESDLLLRREHEQVMSKLTARAFAQLAQEYAPRSLGGQGELGGRSEQRSDL